MSGAAKLGALESRLAHIQDRIATRHGSSVHAWQEYSALRWALPILADVLARNAERAEDVHHQRRDSAYALLANTAVEALAELAPERAADLLARCGDPHVASRVVRALAHHSAPASAHLARLVEARTESVAP